MTDQYFIDLFDGALNSNIWPDAQAGDWVAEVWHEGDWVCIGRFKTKKKAEIGIEVITISEINRLRRISHSITEPN